MLKGGEYATKIIETIRVLRPTTFQRTIAEVTMKNGSGERPKA
jgi:hypothetical protein